MPSLQLTRPAPQVTFLNDEEELRRTGRMARTIHTLQVDHEDLKHELTQSQTEVAWLQAECARLREDRNRQRQLREEAEARILRFVGNIVSESPRHALPRLRNLVAS